MKAKIDKEGRLYINRNGEYRGQYCAFAYPASNGKGLHCGQWCPHFGELEDIYYDYKGLDGIKLSQKTNANKLRLCHGTVISQTILHGKVTVEVE